jgi:hypothetical protein
MIHARMLRNVGQENMVNWNCHGPLKVEFMVDGDYPPFLSVAIYDCTDKRSEHRSGAIANGLLGTRITVVSVHNLLSFTLLHGPPFPCLLLCELYSSLIPPIFLLRRSHCLVHLRIDHIDSNHQ